MTNRGEGWRLSGTARLLGCQYDESGALAVRERRLWT